MKNTFSWELFNQLPIIGIMRNIPQKYTLAIANAFQNAGLTNLEITMNSAGAEDTIALLANKYKGRLNIGAGTVCTLHDLDKVLKAGAQYIVTPIIDKKVIKACVTKNLPIFPGAYTPSEIYKAWQLGASMVKVFPATNLGTIYIKEVLGPLNHIKLAPTGGINLENFIEYFKAGAKAVGIGSHLFPKAIMKSEDWTKLEDTYRQIVEKYNAYIIDT